MKKLTTFEMLAIKITHAKKAFTIVFFTQIVKDLHYRETFNNYYELYIYNGIFPLRLANQLQSKNLLV